VWFDALGNYITALGYGSAGDGAAYRAFWAGDGERLHVIGKGILRFHAVYWPAMLLAAALPLPTAVFVHGYFTVEGQKMSKSLGNVIDPRDIIARYGAAALRWYLLREVHPTADADFGVARLLARYNTDLANDVGNLLNRVNAMLHRYRNGVVPETGTTVPPAADLAALAAELPARVAAAMDAFDPRAALDAVWELVVRGNRTVDEAAPWALHHAEAAGDARPRAALDRVLYALLETVRLVAVHLEPFLPGPAARILEQLGVPADAERPYGERVCWGGLPPGTRTAAPSPVFPKLVATTVPVDWAT
jgi:methionyl-tRNA synthetase